MSQENVEIVRRFWAALNEDPPRLLLEVLDEEVGIGFGDENPNAGNAPLLADLGFPGRLEMRRVSMGSRDLHLMGLIARALKSGALEYFDRRTQQTSTVPLTEAYGFIRGRLTPA